MVHPRLAAELGLADGDWVRISSPRGSIEMRVEVTPILREDWIYVPGGWADANYNYLGIDDDLDPISSQANYTACLGRIERIDGPAGAAAGGAGAGACSRSGSSGSKQGGLLARLFGGAGGASAGFGADAPAGGKEA